MTSFPIFNRLTVTAYGLYPGSKSSPNLDVTFQPGLTLILGANGLGKTTLVTMLYRMCTGPVEHTGAVAIWRARQRKARHAKTARTRSPPHAGAHRGERGLAARDVCQVLLAPPPRTESHLLERVVVRRGMALVRYRLSAAPTIEHAASELGVSTSTGHHVMQRHLAPLHLQFSMPLDTPQ